MLMDIKCCVQPSIRVHLYFDNRQEKIRTISLYDLIEVDYNKNGLRRHYQGKVISINAEGVNPKNWWIVVDGSGDFDAAQERICPMSILDLEIIKKANVPTFIESTEDVAKIAAMRVVDGCLQYTQDGFIWEDVKIKDYNIIPADIDPAPGIDSDVIIEDNNIV